MHGSGAESQPVRTITARVVDYDIKSSGDEYDADHKYATKLSYEGDGNVACAYINYAKYKRFLKI